MRENRPYGSEGGAAKAVPTPIDVADLHAAARHKRRSIHLAPIAP
jgi:hypothetical protein